MATRNEQDTTRARANMLRHVLTEARDGMNAWDSEQVEGVMDLCLSCKGCKSECPSNVDVARLKAEWQQHYHDANGVPFRSRLVANFTKYMRLASLVPALYNCAVTAPGVSRLIKRFAGFSTQRSLPKLHSTTLARWHAKHANPPNLIYPNGRVFLFCDEFTNYNDTPMGIKAVQLLNQLGYEVVIPEHVESGRAHFSKGLIRDAQQFAIRNVELLKDVVSAKFPLIGLEPSCILSFRDEYPDLMPDHLIDAAKALAQNALLIDEFVAREADAGRITKVSFKSEPRVIKLHGHCHQKALSSLTPTVKMLELLAGHKVSRQSPISFRFNPRNRMAVSRHCSTSTARCTSTRAEVRARAITVQPMTVFPAPGGAHSTPLSSASSLPTAFSWPSRNSP